MNYTIKAKLKESQYNYSKQYYEFYNGEDKITVNFKYLQWITIDPQLVLKNLSTKEFESFEILKDSNNEV